MKFGNRWVFYGTLATAFIAASANPAAAISTASQDTFTVSNGGWSIGNNGVQPTQVTGAGADGQPGYLTHFSDAAGIQGKWLMWNDQPQWLGDYSTAGVTGLELWANLSTGTAPADLRIALNGPGGWFYSASQPVTAGWAPLSFELSASGFTYATGSGGTGSFSDTLGGVTRLEIVAGSGGVSYRSNGNLLQAGTSSYTILVDTITAVPEPGLWSAAAVAVVACGSWMRRSRR